jgi:hypothetical protein
LEEQSIQELPPQEKQVIIEPEVQHPQVMGESEGDRRSSKERRSAISDEYLAYLVESNFDVGLKNDPIMFSQVMSEENSKVWYNVMKEDMKSIAKNQV